MRFLVTAGIYRDSGALLSTIETVVDENPLSLATSRMVTIESLTLEERISNNPGTSLCKPPALKFSKEFFRARVLLGSVVLIQGERWPTLQQRVQAVSSIRITSEIFICLLLLCGTMAATQHTSPL